MVEKENKLEGFLRFQQAAAHISDPQGLEVHLVQQLKELIRCNAIVIFHNHQRTRLFFARNPFDLKKDEQSLTVPYDSPLAEKLYTSMAPFIQKEGGPALLSMMKVELFIPIRSPEALLGFLYAGRETAIDFTTEEKQLLEMAAGQVGVALERQAWQRKSRRFVKASEVWRDQHFSLLNALQSPALFLNSEQRIINMNAQAQYEFGSKIVNSRFDEAFNIERRDDGSYGVWVERAGKRYVLSRTQISDVVGQQEVILFFPEKDESTSQAEEEPAPSNQVRSNLPELLKELQAESGDLQDLLARAAFVILSAVAFDYFSVTLLNEDGSEGHSFILVRSTFRDHLPGAYEWQPVSGMDFGWVQQQDGADIVALTGTEELRQRLQIHVSFLLLEKEKYIGNWAFGRAEKKEFNPDERALLRKASPQMAQLIKARIAGTTRPTETSYERSFKAITSGQAFRAHSLEKLEDLIVHAFSFPRVAISEVERAQKELLDRLLPKDFALNLSEEKVTTLLHELSANKRGLCIENSMQFERLLCDGAKSTQSVDLAPLVIQPIQSDDETLAFLGFLWQKDMDWGLFQQNVLDPLSLFIAQRVEQMRLEAELSKRTAELDRLIAIVQDDFREPIRELRDIAELLVQRYARTIAGHSQNYLHQAQRQLDEIDALIKGLALYRSLPTKAERQRIDAAQLAREAWQSALNNVNVEGESIRCIIPEQSFECSCDPSLMKIIFQQLMINAIRATVGNSQPTIEIGWRDLQHVSEFFIRDNGKGIPDALQERIFELFYKVNDKESGAGIGLAVVKKAVQAHGGRIGLEKAHNHTEFRFSIPKHSSVD